MKSFALKHKTVSSK